MSRVVPLDLYPGPGLAAVVLVVVVAVAVVAPAPRVEAVMMVDSVVLAAPALGLVPALVAGPGVAVAVVAVFAIVVSIRSPSLSPGRAY